MAQQPILRKLQFEHRTVLDDLDTVERGIPVLRTAPDGRPRSASARTPAGRTLKVEVLRDFVSRLDRHFDTHMAREEEILFPSVVASLPEAATFLEPLRGEHVELRAILASLAGLLEQPRSGHRDEQVVIQWRDFATLMRIHIRKEEGLMLKLAGQALKPTSRKAVQP